MLMHLILREFDACRTVDGGSLTMRDRESELRVDTEVLPLDPYKLFTNRRAHSQDV